jgi:regulator of sigma E protease
MIGTILLFLLIFSVVILSHEFGHFLVARWMGVRVDEFGIGFPPRIWAWKRKNGMEWSINWIPIGGFVKIFGQDGESRKDPESFAGKSIWRRGFILAAGVLANVVLTVVLLIATFAIGAPSILEGEVDPSAKQSEPTIRVTEVLTGAPAEIAGLKMGDVLLSINGVEFENSEAARLVLREASDSQALTITVERKGEILTLPVTPAYIDDLGGTGIGVGLFDVANVRYPIHIAMVKGVVATWQYTLMIFVAFGGFLWHLVTGAGTTLEVTGPVGIAVMTGDVARLGWSYVLQFAAILSLNLAVFNILPIPALDGGRLFFLVIEGIIRRPVNERVEGFVHQFGFMGLLVLIVVVTFKDIVNLF